jgi:hypothetical protein
MNAREKILEGWDARPSLGVHQEEGVSLRWDQLRYDMRFHAAPSERLPSHGHCPEPMLAAYLREKPKSKGSNDSTEHTKALKKSFSVAVCLIAIPMLFGLCCDPVFRSRYCTVVVASDSAVYLGVLPWRAVRILVYVGFSINQNPYRPLQDGR